jgi:hypothetical protein
VYRPSKNTVKSLLGALLTIAVCLTFPSISIADPQSKSFSTWQYNDGELRATFTVSTTEIAQLPTAGRNPDLMSLFIGQLRSMVKVSTGDQTCPLRRTEPQRASPGYLRAGLTFSCDPATTRLVIVNRALFDDSPSHIHFARVTAGERPAIELLFTRRQPSHEFTLSAASDITPLEADFTQTITTYLVFGFEHIIIGLDHIAFLLALMLLANRACDVLLIVSGFTIGHSVTLSLTILGWVTPQIGMMEAMIGFTIALVAAENIGARDGTGKSIAIAGGSTLAALALLSALAGIGPAPLSLLGLALFTLCYLQLSNSETRARQLRPWITTLFGFVHGFGFASVLMEVGLPTSSVVPALLAFNIGVELGQIALVLVIAAIGLVFHRLLKAKFWKFEELGSALLCGLGVFWFVQRGYF